MLVKKNEEKERKIKGQSRRIHGRAKPMICDSLLCASVTRMALQGSMKSLLIVQSGNWSSQLLAMIDLFTFHCLHPPSQKKKKEKENDAGQPGHQYFVVAMMFLLCSIVSR